MGLKLTPRLALVFILFALAISAGVGILAYYSGRLSLEAAAKTELQSTALEKEAALEAWIFERESSISALARSGYILEQLVEFRESEHNSRQAHDRLIRELSVHTGPGQAFLTLFILAPEDGRVIASVDSGEEGDLRTNLAYFIEGKSGIYTTPIYYSPDLLVPAMTTAAPLYSAEGKLLGVLAGRLNLEELNAIIQRRSALRETDDAFLVNRENQFVTQPRFIPDPAVLKVGVHTELVQRCLAGDSNTMSTVDYRGVPVIAVYRWLSTRQMCLIVKISQAETLAPVERFGTRVIGIALGTLVAASVAALLLSNALLRPIRAMQVAAKRYGRGDLDVRLPETRWDELGELAHEFNQMAGSLAEKEQELRSYAQTLEQKVQERTQKLQTTISQLQRAEQIGQLGSWEWDVPGDHMIVSDGLAQLVGTSPESLGSTLDAYFERIHPGDLERMQQTLANSLQKAGPFEAETRFIRADGQVRTFHARGESAFDADGNPARLIGVVIDITERKQAETQINELLEFNEKVLNMVPVGMLTFEISGQCTYANENAASIIGARVEALMAQNFRELESWKRSGLFSLAEKAIAGKVHVVADIHHVSTFGRDVWLRASAVTFSSRDREQLLLTISDITERKLAEEAIRESEDKFRYLFDHSIIGKSITFPDGTMDVNDAFCAMIGYPKSDLKSKNWREITHPDDVRASEEAIAPLLAREADSTRFTKRYLHSNGSIVWADVNTVLRRDPDGKPVYFLTALLDITERKEAEEALQRLTEDLRRSNAELEQFAYVASHDLQEPLRMISSYMHLLSDRYTGRLDSDADEFIQYAVDGATRMQNLINDLLAYSRVGTRGKEHIPVSMENVLKDALANLEFAIEENGARITHEALPLICGDPLQLVMVLQNLIGNAIKFRGAESPRIHMDARRQGGEWLFSISDNGIGFDQKFAERVFVIFQRLHTRGAYPGTGIGLAICKRIILRHGGRIWVESQRGQGSVFNFTLPALEAA